MSLIMKDLESWDYKYVSLYDEYAYVYISQSRRIYIIFDTFVQAMTGHGWLWRVYDNGWNGPLEEMVVDRQYFDHEFTGFDSAEEAYRDICLKGMERVH